MRVLITGSTDGFGLYLSKSFYKKHIVIDNARLPKDHYGKEFLIRDADNIILSDLKNYNPDIIINNASDDSLLQVNFLRRSINYFTTQEKKGIIININSVAGIKPDVIKPTYSASKFALRGYSESVKDECLKQGIRIIDLYIGAIACGRSSNREDFDKLIQPVELANFITLLYNTKSFYVREIHLQRTNVQG
jgi:NAD(P)-dependent dehydrogenase (short-subunit alcohol dehydrogenase family)